VADIDHFHELFREPLENAFHEIHFLDTEREADLRHNADHHQLPVDGPAVITEEETNENEKEHA
jgi:hypothetical protein